MATVNATQFEFLSGDNGGKLGQAGFHDGNETASNITVSSTGNLITGAKTRFVMLTPDADVYYKVGSVAADGASTRIPADVMIVIGIKPGATIYFDDGTFA